MKKKVMLLLLSAIMSLSLIACGDVIVDNANDEVSQQLQKDYDFYNDSIDVLKDGMDLDTEHANAVFKTLISIGLDEEITYCFDEDNYYKVWWGLAKVDVYLSDGTVEKIVDGEELLYSTTEEVLNIPNEIIWKDEEKMGIVNLELDGTRTKEVIIINYYREIADYLKELDKSGLHDCDYIRFVGNVTKDNKIECAIKGDLAIDYIKNTDTFLSSDVEKNITELFIPKPLQ